MPHVTVRAARNGAAQGLAMDRTLSRTVVDAAELERRQASSVFEVLDAVPGVAVNGGPRASGMSFNIRGYTDSEDVQVRVDGVVKGFEKYRFGGTFIEPDLIKTLEVRRGAQIESGAGALGGTVLATTKDAADLLRPGQRFGARARLGYTDNNDERLRFVSLYGRPSDQLDLLAARSVREGGELRLAGGERLPLSAVDSGSDLLKASWFPHDQWAVTASWLRYQDQGVQPYDTTGGVAGLFGQVQRRIDDETLSLRTRWTDRAKGHEWTTTVGQARTRVRDHFEKGWSVFSLAAAMDDDIDMRGHTAETAWRWRVADWGGGGSERQDSSAGATAPGGAQGHLDVRVGVQVGRQARTSRRVTASSALNDTLYPGGFNPAQPAGTKTMHSAYVQPEWRHGSWQVLPGLRWDRVVVRADGPARERLAAFGQAPRVAFHHTAPSLLVAVDVVPDRWTLFAQAARAFRPPLLDEAFSQGPYGACNEGVLTGGVPGYPTGTPVAPPSGMCGEFYTAETSRSEEWGVSTRQRGLLGSRSLLTAKLTLFRHRTGHLLESLQARPGGSGELIQPGWERRHGAELEAALQAGPAFASLSASRIRGDTFDGDTLHALTTAPGDQLHLSVGWRWARVEAALRWRRVGERLATDVDAQQREVFVTQQGYRLLGASVRWQISDALEAVLSGDNLENVRYRLNNGFGGGIGTEAPGRQVRLSLAGRY